MKKETYFGVEVSPLSYEEIVDTLKLRIHSGEQSTIIAVNPEKVMAAQNNPQLKELINGSTFQIPDGVGILLASKLKGGDIQSRVTGVDMMERLLLMAEQEGYKVFLYGAKEEVVSKAAANIQIKHPAIQLGGYENGYVQDQEELVERINESGADILFVALGSPRQELWIRENMPRLNVKVFQGVGGSFDVYAGHVQRAPEGFRKLGLEWLYRLMKEPKRFKRQLALPKFLLKVLFTRKDQAR
ncbi:N-acetylglucosaminyldiphosphoundecaprenol N-acetyl-beta-D-mannosaminyltransferase [Bacillus oleivorans]|uniref:N-acetylglucosaminyldiphosphoundecaprenol N-acetyl-beta-D-mannosaminyltransferase n=1 Tax=Bacillus oleivorans TaxID=1448271 RepID=A0A285CJ19_9BACI|nr:WecB/TagA/CpsF family glycosyltransferase [Bacillus oleivorans]SNX67345.1 N-acetylglucosaminyldiphosphoundecaprenol N-acetyl-beta-D-mannosaminyltransferase [Bacillus oleivorans]